MNVLVDEQSLKDIGDAIRGKYGNETKYKPREMGAAITNIPSGGGDLPEEALVISGNCNYRFTQGGWDWFIEEYGNRITTKDITVGTYMFWRSNLENIPFELNCQLSKQTDINHIFYSMYNLTSVPKLNNCQVDSMNHMFNECHNLRYLPEDIGDWFDWSYMEQMTSAYGGNRSYMFSRCYSLRSIPMDFLNHVNKLSIYSYSYFYSGFGYCLSLDELVNLPIPYTATWTNNTFNSSFDNCSRLKNLTFAMPDGNPYVVKWKNQTIDLTDNVGSVDSEFSITNYNSGITKDKCVRTDEQYQALKNDPDWYSLTATGISAYSRYNHDSAVATINSLPDTSAYLSTAGGTNTIKFKGAAGAKTDGGAINTLTAEEIAVATAKGWTLTFA